MADASYYAKKKKEQEERLRQAQKAMEAQTSSTAKSSTPSSSSSSSSYYAQKKKEQDKRIQTAQNAMASTMKSSLSSALPDIQKRFTSEIDSYNKTQKPAFGSFDQTYASQRERRLALNTLRNDILAYTPYMDKAMADSLVSTLDQMESGYDAYLGMSEFKTKDEYDTAARKWGYSQKYQGKTYDELEAIMKDMADGEEKEWVRQYAPSTMTSEDYKKQLEAIGPNIDATSKHLEDLYARRYTLQQKITGYSRGYVPAGVSMKALREELMQLNAEIKEAEGALEGLKTDRWKMSNDSKYHFLSDEADFAQNSKYSSTESEGMWGKMWSQYNLGYDDLTYEFINNQGDIRDQINQKARSYGADTGKTTSSYQEKHYDLMNEQEVANYNYLYSTQGKKAAEEYLEYLEYTLNERAMGNYARNAAAFADEHPVISSIYTVPANLMSGVGALDVLGQNMAKGIKETLTGEYAGPVDYNRDSMALSVGSSAIRGTVAQNIADATGTIDIDPEKNPVWASVLNGKSLGDVYQLGMSMVDSAAVAGLTAMGVPGGTYLLAGSAASQGILDAVARGATDEQALTMGLLSGAAEWLFERYEIDSLIKNAKDGFTKALLKSAFSESVGEGSTTIANLVTDALVMAENSEWQVLVDKYMAAGMSQSDAEKQALLDMVIQVGWDAIGGGFMGGAMGGGMSVANYAWNKATHAEYKGMDTQGMQETVAEALEINPDNAYAQKMQGKLDAGKDLNSIQINKLVQQNQKTLLAQDTAKIQEAAAERLTSLGETGDVQLISSALANQAAGKKLSKAETAAIADSKYGQRVANELNPENIRSGEYATSWAEGLNTDQINPDEYGAILAKADQESAQKDRSAMSERLASTIKGTTSSIYTSPNFDVKMQQAALEAKREAAAAEAATEGEIPAPVKTAPTSIDEAAVKYGKQAGAFKSSYLPKQDLAKYDAGFQQVYNYAMTGQLSLAAAKQYKASYPDSAMAYLTDAQIEFAYVAGDTAAKAKTQSTAGANIAGTPYNAKTHTKGTLRAEGGVTVDGLNKRFKRGSNQRTAVSVLRTVAEVTGLNIVLYDSADHNYEGAQGYYKRSTPDTLYLDVSAGIADIRDVDSLEKYVMLRTFNHEFTHVMENWSPAEWGNLRDIVLKHMEEGGFNIDEMVEKYQRADYEARYLEYISAGMDSVEAMEKADAEKLSYDDAIREIVADAMTDILPDSKFIQEVAEKHQNIFQKILSELKKFLAKIRRYFDGLADNPYEQAAAMKEEVGGVLRYMEDVVAAWDAAAIKTVENIQRAKAGEIVDLDGDATSHDGLTQFSRKSFTEAAGFKFETDDEGYLYRILDRNGNPVKKATAAMMKQSPMGEIVNIALENKFIDDASAKKQYQMLADLMNLIIENRDAAMVWEISGTMLFSAIKSNSDTQYGTTIDFSTVCKKTQAIVDAMSATMKKLGRGLTREEVERTYLETGLAGESTPCPVCYVFSRWMGIGGILDQINNYQKEYVGKSEAWLASFINKVESEAREHAINKKLLTKKGEPKIGGAISDLKSKEQTKIKSLTQKLADSANAVIQIDELKALREQQTNQAELKETDKKIRALQRKVLSKDQLRALEKEIDAHNTEVKRYEAYQWMNGTLMMQDEAGNWVKNPAYKPVDPDVLFDLNAGDVFAEKYPLTWKFRTGKGCSAGKAIIPYSDARLGETIQGVASLDTIKIGEDINPFLNGDAKARKTVVEKAIAKIAKQNLIGGQRYQSTSDFRYEYGSDYFITFLEMQAIGAKVQLYTKVVEAVDFLCSVGADVNMSVMPLSDGYITMEDGTKKLIYSSVTGIDADAAIALSRKYSNAQLILVGISDEHIRLALEGTDVTFVIPFHGSGNTTHQIQTLMNLLGENLDVTKARDYTFVQSDHVKPDRTAKQKAMWDLRVKIITGKNAFSSAEMALLEDNPYLKELHRKFYEDKSSEAYHCFLAAAQAEQIFPYEYWDRSLNYDQADQNGERFKEYCETLGIIPRFSGKNSKGEDVGFGDFTNAKGYWKLLIDRPMYDNVYDAAGNWIGYGAFHQQQRINVTNVQIEQLNPEWGSQTYGDVMSKSNDRTKTDAIANKVVDWIKSQEGVQKQLRPSDKAYMDAVNRGDMEAAQRMVAEAAKAAGYRTKVYHGTRETTPITVFDGSANHMRSAPVGFNWFAADITGSEYYADARWGDGEEDGPIYKLYLKDGRYMDVGDTSADWDDWISWVVKNTEITRAEIDGITSLEENKWLDGVYGWEIVGTKAFADLVKQKGYDGVTAIEWGGRTYGVIDANRVKSADPVVKDNAGKVIPLSERFNAANDDIRYQRRPAKNSTGRDLSPEQQEFFKDSKVRDDQGRLIPMYHGTNSPNFTVFDPQKSDDNISLFFTSDPDVANTYTQLQDKGRDVDPYNLITEDSTAEQFNKAQERVGGGLRVVKITSDWIQEMKAKAEKSATRLFGMANKYADLLEYNNSTGMFSYDIERIREVTGKGVENLKADHIYNKLRKAMGDANQHSFFARDHKGAEKEIRRLYSDTFKLFDEVWNYKTAAATPDSAIGQYTYTETNSSVPFMLDRNLDFEGHIIPGTEREMVAKALDRMNWVDEHHLGNRYKVYLNITNPYVIDAGVTYSGKMKTVSLERSTFNEKWKVAFENDEYDEERYMSTSAFMKFIESAFDAKTTANIKAQIEADNEAYRKEWGDDFYEDMDVAHDIQLKNVNLNYTEAGNWNSLNFNGKENAKTREVAAWAKENGYDGVIFKNMKDAGGYAFMKGRGGSTVVAAFSSEQVKSVDNLNPTSDPDIRYQRRVTPAMDSEYAAAVKANDMAKAQEMVNAAAKAAGFPAAGFHGTMNGGHTVFDRHYAHVGGNSGAGFYFSTSKRDSDANYSDVEGADNYFKWSALAEQIMDMGEWDGEPVEDYGEATRIAKAELNKNPQTYSVFMNLGKSYIRDFKNSTNLYDEVMEGFDESVIDRDDYDDEYDYEDAVWEARSDHVYQRVYEAVYNAIRELEDNYDVMGSMGVDDIAQPLAERVYEYESLDWEDIISVFESSYSDITVMRDGWASEADASREIARLIVEDFGYNSITDKEVSIKFKQLIRSGENATHYIVFNSNQIKSADPVTYDDNGNVIPLSERFNKASDDIRYQRRVTDKEQLKFLNDQVARGEYTTVYKALLKIGDTYYPPMASLEKDENGRYTKLRGGQKLFDWIESEGNLTEEMKSKMNMKSPKKWLKDYAEAFESGLNPWGMYGDFKLQKADEEGNKDGDVTAAYNPYQHSSDQVLNDQFEAAYKRPGLVVVECRIPNSELTKPYWAPYAKDPTGMHEWKTGPIAGQLKKTTRHVYMTRWIQPVRELSHREVAEKIRDIVVKEDTAPRVYWNTINPKVLEELVNLGVEIDPYGSPMHIAKENALDMYGNPITDELRAEREAEKAAKKAAKKSKTQTQLRTKLYTDREILEMAAGRVDQANLTAGEQDALNIFQERLGKLHELQDKRLNQGQLYKQQMFGKGTVDRAEAKKTLHRMNILDAQIKKAENALLDVEEKQVLKQVLQKAKAVVREEQRAHDQEAMERYRNRRKEAADVKKYRERVEEKTKKLTEMLLKNSDKEHIPEALKGVVGDFITSIDFTSKRALRGGEATKKDKSYEETLDRLRQVLQKQADYMANPENGSGMDFYLDMPADFADLIQKHINTVKAAASSMDLTTVQVNLMSAAELQDLDFILTVLTKTISTVNKLHVNAHFASVVDASRQTMVHLNQLKADTGKAEKIRDFAEWGNTLPYYAFKRFGDAGQAIFEGLQDGWDKLAMNTKAVLKFTQSAYTEKEVNAWGNQLHTIELESGEKVQMTAAQIMSLYCLAKREQAVGHLLGGGMRVGNADVKTGAKTSKLRQTEPFVMTLNDVAAITSKLTPRQIEVAKRLQNYMNTVGTDWGNEVSMARFGYRAFTEDNYFPIESDRTNLPAIDPDAKANDMFRLLNLSLTKSLTYKANNALVVSDIFDVFANHMTDMAKYNALALPVLDTMKWYNYKDSFKNPTNGQIRTATVQRTIERAYGKSGNNYFITFIKDLNGTHEGGRGEGFASQMISNYKVAAVGANLRVALLQPTAYVRASAVMSPGAMLKALVMKPAVKEMLKHSGTAAWKDLGFYDTNIGRGVRDQIKNAATIKDKVVEKSMILAEIGDKITWGAIWNACKAEQMAKGIRGDKLMEATAKRFREVIYTTQVMDSTMTRSHNMRSKSLMAKTMTAFMSEPTVSYNLLLDAYSEYNAEKRRGGKAWAKHGKKITRALAAYGMSALAAAVIESIADALRDDDDYETFMEKWLEAFAGDDGKIMEGNLMADLNPLNKIPILKDVLNAVSGYENNRMDTQWIDSIVDAYNAWKSGGNYTLYGKIYKTLQALSRVAGAPVSNLSREAITIWNNTLGVITGMKVKTYDPGAKANIKEAFASGHLTEEEAISELVNNDLVETADDAYFTVQGWAAKAEGEDYSRYGKVMEAVKLGGDFDAAVDELLAHGYTEKQIIAAVKDQIGDWYRGTEDEPQSISKQQAIDMLTKYTDMDSDAITKQVNKWSCKVVTGIEFGDIKDEYLAGNITEARAIEMYSLYGGYEKSEAAELVTEWKSEKETGIAYGDIKEAFMDGELTETEAKNMYITYGGYTAESANEKVTVMAFVRDHPSCKDISYAAVQDYKEFCEPYNVPAESYYGTWKYKNADGTGWDRDGDGKKDAYSVAGDTMAYIGSLPLSSSQKTALARSFGWAEKTIRDYKTW